MRRERGADEVGRFLAERHGQAVDGLEPLQGGFWSSAYGYRADGRDLVLRLGKIREGFEMDRAAMAYDAPDLPVPEVLEIGDAFDGAYAISVRHRGRFLESVEPDEAAVVGPTIMRLLCALRTVPARDASASWREWLMAGFVDDPEAAVSGWRDTLAARSDLDRLFRTCEARVGEFAARCPERRDLVHGDLLHANVLVNGDASRVNAVFSWKCSTWGDFLFDVAWCTFWSGFHPGIEAADVFNRAVAEPSIISDGGSLDGAAERHHCYELHIGATHLGWSAWVGDEDALQSVAANTEMVLERGPLRSPDA